MRHPFQAYVQLQYFTMIITLILGAIALINQSTFLALLGCITLALSLGCEGLVEWKKKRVLPFAQQIIRSVLIVIFVCYIYFR
ncbi:hypothetical protein [Aquibacillus kalidii]|uniref:hypothetical protein n=1 Tax=Aquibacillus kalidii TaxID=2762597 RepID=UPI001645E28A|nr:hypothetical protein [Aquibacillus kalidii]